VPGYRYCRLNNAERLLGADERFATQDTTFRLPSSHDHQDSPDDHQRRPEIIVPKFDAYQCQTPETEHLLDVKDRKYFL
jgi:hypothetical protein